MTEAEFVAALDVLETELLVNIGSKPSDAEIRAYDRVLDLYRKALNSQPIAQEEEMIAKVIYEAGSISGVPWESPLIRDNVFRGGKARRQAQAVIDLLTRGPEHEEDDIASLTAQVLAAGPPIDPTP